MLVSRSWKRFLRRCFPLLLLLWVLVVLYPNPLNLVTSLQRILNPQIDAAAAAGFCQDMPSDASAIESCVLERIPYSYDWETHGMPWYFPTVEEVLENGQGDCKSRALVLASVFEAKGIPYTINWSPIHVWVDYEGKDDNSLENTAVTFYEQDPETGERSLQLPRISPRQVLDVFWGGFWEPMPDMRKVVLICGLAALVVLRLTWLRRGNEGKAEHAPIVQGHVSSA